jgi:hypothetical protein
VSTRKERVSRRTLGIAAGAIVLAATAAGLFVGCQAAGRVGNRLSWMLTGVERVTALRNGNRIVAVEQGSDKWFTAIGNRPGPDWDVGLVYSPDRKHVAYRNRKGDRWFVEVDDQPGPEYDEIAEDDPVFSPDSRRIAYGAR